MYLSNNDLKKFVSESNSIEDIYRSPTESEMESHRRLLNLPQISLDDLVVFVREITGIHQPLRDREGMNVQVGDHIAPPGGVAIPLRLSDLVDPDIAVVTDVEFVAQHRRYENLHPFQDGNGRSGRALWLWGMLKQKKYYPSLKFLRQYYYQTLS